jgi:hypothetical protein
LLAAVQLNSYISKYQICKLTEPHRLVKNDKKLLYLVTKLENSIRYDLQRIKRKHSREIKIVNELLAKLEETPNSSTNENTQERLPVITKYIDLLNEDADLEIELENESDSDDNNERRHRRANRIAYTPHINDPKPFNGTQNEVFTDWQEEMENTFKFQYSNITDIRKIRILRNYLLGEARIFFDSLQINEETKYEHVMLRLRLKFDKPFGKRVSEYRLIICRMKENETVTEFIKRFKEIAEEALKDEPEDIKNKRMLEEFRPKLKPNIAYEVYKSNPTTMKDAEKAAIEEEKVIITEYKDVTIPNSTQTRHTLNSPTDLIHINHTFIKVTAKATHFTIISCPPLTWKNALITNIEQTFNTDQGHLETVKFTATTNAGKDIFLCDSANYSPFAIDIAAGPHKALISTINEPHILVIRNQTEFVVPPWFASRNNHYGYKFHSVQSIDYINFIEPDTTRTDLYPLYGTAIRDDPTPAIA